MGLHGSSTTPVILHDVKVPADAVLGEVGKGHKVAFNVLNFGRFKLGAMCSGGGRASIGESARYAATRKQFGVPIATFGAIKHKLGEMIAREFALESMMYRTAGLIDAYVQASGQAHTDGRPMLQALEEFAVEASIAKVLGSEVVDFIVDENVQIHGGNGFVRDYDAERHYRDARVNRIFEGTNEINRLLIPGMLVRRAVAGKLGLLPAAQALMDEVLSPSLPSLEDEDAVLAGEVRLLRNAKKVALMVLGTAAQKYMMALAEQQEVLLGAADIIMDVYAMESAILRAQKLAAGRGEEEAALHLDMTRVFCNDAVGRIEAAARDTLAAMSEGDELRTLLAALKRFTKNTPINTVAARQRVADAMIRANKYIY